LAVLFLQPFAVASTQDATKHSPGMFFPNQRFGASVSCTSCNSLSGCYCRNVIKLHCLGNKRLEDRFGGPLFAAVRSGKHSRCYKIFPRNVFPKSKIWSIGLLHFVQFTLRLLLQKCNQITLFRK